MKCTLVPIAVVIGIGDNVMAISRGRSESKKNSRACSWPGKLVLGVENDKNESVDPKRKRDSTVDDLAAGGPP